ncbi:MAG: hypothetical protein M0R51_15865 [Clostridia bacterium]|jgi:hypothetical protein|nr:hypothetical protein [Clostridia bacterium]
MIISYDKQQAIKPVSLNNQSIFEQIAKETEMLELSALLGIAFYQEIDNNKEKYSEILNATTFVNSQGYNITHQGLYYVIAYLVFAKYIANSYVNDTFSGFVKKNLQNSEHLNEGERRRLQYEYRSIALTAFETIKEYLTLKNTDYPLWGCKVGTTGSLPKFYTVTNKQYYAS